MVAEGSVQKGPTPPRRASNFTIRDVTHLLVCHVLVGLPEFRVPFLLGRAVGEQASQHDRGRPHFGVSWIPELLSGERSGKVGFGRRGGAEIRSKDHVLRREKAGTLDMSVEAVLRGRVGSNENGLDLEAVPDLLFHGPLDVLLPHAIGAGLRRSRCQREPDGNPPSVLFSLVDKERACLWLTEVGVRQLERLVRVDGCGQTDGCLGRR